MAPFILENGGEIIEHDYAALAAYSVKGRISYRPDYRFPTHWHNDIELSVVLRGQMDYNVNGSVMTVREGEGMFINARQLHANYSPDRSECEYLCILLHPMTLCVNPLFEQEYVAPLLANEQLAFVRLTEQVPWQREILEECRGIYRDRQHPAAPLLIQAHFCRLWAVLFEHADRHSPSAPESGDLTVVKEMVAFIQEHYRHRPGLEEIAAAGSVGQSKCCRLFRRYLNLSPNAYLTQCRLDHSRELLQNTDLSMSEIAEAVGYSGASYFSESFRRWYGMTPSEYKERAARRQDFSRLPGKERLCPP